jgi:ribosomal protein S20
VIGDADSSISDTTDSASDLRTAMRNVRKAIDPVGDALDDLTLENTLLQRAVAKGTMTQNEAIAVMNRMTREALGLDNTIADLEDQQKKVEAAFRAGVLSISEYEKAIDDIRGAVIDYRAETERTYGAGAIQGIKDYYRSISDNAKSATDFVAGAFGGLERSMSDFFYTGNLDFGGFIDAIKRGLADLAAKAVISVGLNFLGKVFPNLAFADGGLIPGTGGPRADNVLARVSSGEYVIKASSVSKFGTGFFDALNAGQMPNMGGGGFSINAGLMEGLTPGFFLGGLFDAIGDIIRGIADAIGDVVRGVIDAVKAVVGAISNAVKGLVEAIVGGDLLNIAAFALPFILPGVGAAIAGNLAAGTGFIGSVSGGISTGFANGILGSGNLAAIAQSVGIEFAKGAITDKMSDAIASKVLGITGDMAASGGAYEQDRAARFGRLYNDAAPYLAGMTGARFAAGDNVRVGERGEELLIPGRNGMVAPIKGSANDLIDVVKDMKEEIVLLRRQMSRVIAGGQLVGARA